MRVSEETWIFPSPSWQISKEQPADVYFTMSFPKTGLVPASLTKGLEGQVVFSYPPTTGRMFKGSFFRMLVQQPLRKQPESRGGTFLLVQNTNRKIINPKQLFAHCNFDWSPLLLDTAFCSELSLRLFLWNLATIKLRFPTVRATLRLFRLDNSIHSKKPSWSKG